MMVNRKQGHYKVRYPDDTVTVAYWNGSKWLFHGVISEMTDEELNFQFIWPVHLVGE